MDSLDETAYCGLYCPDCIHYRNKYGVYANQLKNELENVEFDKYAEINGGYRANFENYKKFLETLNALSSIQCGHTCRVGGGCSGKPCKVMDCCLSKGFKGCWECNEIDACEKFDFLEPLCGDGPKKNLEKIKKLGVENWIASRDGFYIWQR